MKSIFSFLAGSLCAFIFHNQAWADNVYTVVPQVSLMQSTLKGSDISGSQAGYDIGATMQWLVSDGLSVESGLLYSKMGAKTDALWVTNEYDLRYVRMPLGVMYRPGGNDSSWYTRGGAYMAYLTSSERKFQFFGAESSQKMDDDTNKLDYGLYVGGGYTHNFGDNVKLNFELNYGRGLTKVFKNIDAVNESLGLAVGFLWSI